MTVGEVMIPMFLWTAFCLFMAFRNNTNGNLILWAWISMIGIVGWLYWVTETHSTLG